MGPGKGFRFYFKYNACEKGLVRSGYALRKRATGLVVDWMWGWKQKGIKDDMQVFGQSSWCHSLRWEIWAGNAGFLCFYSLLFCGGLGGDISVAQNSSITYNWSTFSLWAQILFTSLNCGKVGKAQLHFCAGFATSCLLLLCKLGSMGEEAAFSDFCDSIAQTFFLQPQELGPCLPEYGTTALYLVTHVDRCVLHVPLCKMKASTLPDLYPQGCDQGWEENSAGEIILRSMPSLQWHSQETSSPKWS